MFGVDVATREPLTTTVSAKGQVTLPKAIRQALGWDAGTLLVVLTREGGLMVQPLRPFAETKPADVFGCLAYDGPPKTIEEMDTAVFSEAARGHAGSRH